VKCGKMGPNRILFGLFGEGRGHYGDSVLLGFGGRRVLARDLMKSEFCLVKVNQ